MITIARGIKPAQHVWSNKAYACVYCRSVFYLTDDDANIVTKCVDDQRDGMFVVVTCPVCEQERSLTLLKNTKTYRDSPTWWDKRIADIERGLGADSVRNGLIEG